jgi:hypothetical protein
VITRIIELSCDHDSCDAAYGPSPDELTSLRLTRVGATIAGWTRDRDRDYCPDHPRADLTDRIRTLAGQRLTDAEIGQRLGVSRATVYAHRSRHDIPAGLGRVGRPSLYRADRRTGAAA